MQQLQDKAAEKSGISLQDAFSIDEVNIYQKIGHGAFVKLSTEFYNRVFKDEKEPWFKEIFIGSSKEEAIQNQYEFFIQRMGGPPLFSQRKGHPALLGRNQDFKIDDKGAKRWLEHMKEALDSVPEIDDDSKKRMFNFFSHTAFFISNGLEKMNQ